MKIFRLFVAFTLICFALSPSARAVIPAPDGGYPGNNTAEGDSALFSLTSGLGNTGLGFQALFHNTIGNNNTAEGFRALFNNTRGVQNTANGMAALRNNTTGSFNTATGASALVSCRTGARNTATGASALFSCTTGSSNTAIGVQALLNNTTGGANIAIGDGAGSNLTTGNSNIDIGDPGVAGESQTTRIAPPGFNPFAQMRTFIAGIRGVTTGNADAVPVLIDSSGQLGTTSSSRRFKKEIRPMEQASESILRLKPVTFQYKSDNTNTPQFGLIAEEVADVNPDLVVRDEKGEIYTVRYDQVNAMLLNEFLKAHRQVQEQQNQIEKLTAQMKEQAEQIRKVNEKMEMSRPAPQMAFSNQ
jgi:hypothetical protein